MKRETRNLKLPRWLVALIGLGLALLAQRYLDQSQDSPDGRLLLVIGLAVIVWALPGLPGSPAAVPPGAGGGWPWERRGRLPFLLSLILAAAAAVYTYRNAWPRDALILWLLSLIALAAALWRGRGSDPIANLQPPISSLQSPIPNLSELLTLAGLIALGGALRLVNLEQIPTFVHGDEAYFGTQAMQILDGKVPNLFLPGFQVLPQLHTLPVAWSMTLFGRGLLALRLSSALTGLLSLPFLYLLARRFLGRPAALFAVLLLAVGSWDIHFSRNGLDNIQVAPVAILLAGFTLRATDRGRPTDWAILGALGGLTFHLYYSARILPLAPALFLAGRFILDGNFRRQALRPALLTVIAGLIVAAPQLGYYLAHWDQFLIRAADTSVTSNLDFVRSAMRPDATLPEIYLRQVERMALAFNLYPDSSGQYGAHHTLLDSLSGVLALAGLAYLLRYIHQNRNLVYLLLWYMATVIFAGVLIISPPNAPRLIALTPLLALVGGIVVDRWLAALPPGRSRQWVWAGLILLSVWIGLLNYETYFHKYSRERTGFHSPTEVARYLGGPAANERVYLVGGELMSIRTSQVGLIAPRTDGVDLLYPIDFLPSREPPTRSQVYLMMPDFIDIVPALRAYYPQGEYQEHRAQPNALSFATFRPGQAAIAATQGLTARYRDATGRTWEEHVAGLVDDWAARRPADVTDPVTVEWVGSLFAPVPGLYRFTLQGPGAASLALDGKTVVIRPAGQQQATGQVTLAKGWHPFQATYQGETRGRLAWLWTPPAGDLSGTPAEGAITASYLGTAETVFGLLGTYYEGDELQGTPRAQQIDPAIVFYINPLRRYAGHDLPFAALWTGQLLAPADGTYRFFLTNFAGAVWMNLDGRPVFPRSESHAPIPREASVTLTRGPHQLEIGLSNPRGYTQRLTLEWIPPGGERSLVPPSVLRPGR